VNDRHEAVGGIDKQSLGVTESGSRSWGTIGFSVDLSSVAPNAYQRAPVIGYD